MPSGPEPVSEPVAAVVDAAVVVAAAAVVVVVDVAAEGGGASIAAASNSAGLNFLDLPTVKRWRILLGQVLSY